MTDALSLCIKYFFLRLLRRQQRGLNAQWSINLDLNSCPNGSWWSFQNRIFHNSLPLLAIGPFSTTVSIVVPLLYSLASLEDNRWSRYITSYSYITWPCIVYHNSIQIYFFSWKDWKKNLKMTKQNYVCHRQNKLFRPFGLK